MFKTAPACPNVFCPAHLLPTAMPCPPCGQASFLSKCPTRFFFYAFRVSSSSAWRPFFFSTCLPSVFKLCLKKKNETSNEWLFAFRHKKKRRHEKHIFFMPFFCPPVFLFFARRQKIKRQGNLF